MRRRLERVVRRALWGTGTILLIARTVEDALQIVGRRGRELDVAIMAFSEACHGITLLSAIHGCCEQLPTLVVVDEDSEHASTLAYANGARFCLSEPVSSVELANAIADLQPADNSPSPKEARAFGLKSGSAVSQIECLH